jgi:hypothetical protein
MRYVDRGKYTMKRKLNICHEPHMITCKRIERQVLIIEKFRGTNVTEVVVSRGQGSLDIWR